MIQLAFEKEYEHMSWLCQSYASNELGARMSQLIGGGFDIWVNMMWIPIEPIPILAQFMLHYISGLGIGEIVGLYISVRTTIDGSRIG